jgi:hypothetical protein
LVGPIICSENCGALVVELMNVRPTNVIACESTIKVESLEHHVPNCIYKSMDEAQMNIKAAIQLCLV